MAWAVWLAVPALVTLLVAVWTWLRSRPPRQPSTIKAMRQHSEYLEALGATLPGCPASPFRPQTVSRAEPDSRD